MTIKWNINGSILYSEETDNTSKKNKIASFDLDHTLIKPIGDRTHPKDKNDFELVFPNIIEKMKDLHKQGFIILVFSNQDDLINKPEKKEIVLYRIQTLYDQVFQANSIPVQFFISTGRDYCRKPNTGLMDFFYELKSYESSVKNSFYVGDAAGRTKTHKDFSIIDRKKDFSCSDRMFALNCKIKFMTPEQFFEEDDHRAFLIEKTFETNFMKEDKDGKLEKQYINWEKISKYNIVMLLAPPGAGKSSLAHRMLNEFGYTDIINMDTYKTKNKCLKMFDGLLKLEKKRIIIDNTHSKKSSRKDYLDLMKKNKSKEKVLLLKLNVDKTQSFFLNNFRCKVEKTKRLGDVVIHSYFKFYEEPKLEEGFDKIIEIPFIPNFKGKPKERELFNQYY